MEPKVPESNTRVGGTAHSATNLAPVESGSNIGSGASLGSGTTQQTDSQVLDAPQTTQQNGSPSQQVPTEPKQTSRFKQDAKAFFRFVGYIGLMVGYFAVTALAYHAVNWVIKEPLRDAITNSTLLKNSAHLFADGIILMMLIVGFIYDVFASLELLVTIFAHQSLLKPLARWARRTLEHEA